MRLRLSTKKLLIWTVLAAALVVVGYGFAVWHVRAQLSRLAVLDAEVDKLASTDGELSALLSAIEDTKEQVKNVDSYFISSDGVVRFVSLIESLARENNMSVDIEGLEAQEVDKTTRSYLEKVVLRVETRGKWQDTQLFLHHIEHLPYKVAIEGMTIDKVDDPAGARSPIPQMPQWKGEFVLTALKLK